MPFSGSSIWNASSLRNPLSMPDRLGCRPVYLYDPIIYHREIYLPPCLLGKTFRVTRVIKLLIYFILSQSNLITIGIRLKYLAEHEYISHSKFNLFYGKQYFDFAGIFRMTYTRFFLL